MELLELGGGIGAQVGSQALPDSLVVLQRLGGASAASQREHQLTSHPLIERVLGRPPGQLAHQLGVPPVTQREIGAVECGGSLLGMQRHPQSGTPGPVEPAQRLSAPEPDGFVEQRQSALVVLGRQAAGLARQVTEPVQVDQSLVHGEHIAPGVSADRRAGGAQRAA